MTLRRWFCAVGVLAIIIVAAYVGAEAEAPGTKMTKAATDIVGSLSPDQKKKAMFAFDDEHRTKWYFTPQQDAKKQPSRKGLAMKDMDEKQRKLVLELLSSGLSDTGKTKAVNVMSLESVLRDLEKGSGPGRDPEWYFLSIFGTPQMTGKWGWRLEGHHLSLNFTVENGQIVSGTPAFYGANPREVLAGDRKGFRALPREEDLARQLLKSLKDEQKKVALINTDPKGEIPEGNPQPKAGKPQGLAAADMTADQKKLLESVLKEYTANLAPEIGAALMKEVMDAGLDKVHFAWWGREEARQGHRYAIQGPTFLLEFVCTQNDANHIHSCWRSLKGDFGIALK